MFGRRVTLFRLFGFEIRLDWSWLVIAVLITWSLAQGVFPTYYQGLAAPTYWWMGVAGALGLFASVVVHELSHSLVARRFGLVMRGITLFIFGGVSQITREAARPLAEFIMAFAGPATSVLLAGVFGLLWWLTGAAEDQPLAVILQWLWLMNLLLGAFNLAPGFPMDGGRILRSVLWGVTGNYRRSTRWASRVGQLMAYTLMAFGFAGVVRLVSWLDPVGSLWLIVLGMFLDGAARQS